MSTAILKPVKETLVGMGQIAFGRAPDRLASILGSCVAVSLYHPRMRQGVLAHVILPDSQNRPQALPGKFADTALPHMLALLVLEGVPSSGLVAKLVGGANMFGLNGPLQIGAANGETLARLLAGQGIRVIARDIGGNQGRRISFNCGTGEISVEIAGAEVRVI